MEFKKLKVASFITALLSLPFALQAADNPSAAHEHKEIHWSYTGETGPEHWADLDKSFELCRTGKEQSPIDIKSTQTIKHDGLAFEYQPAMITFVNNGHTVQANLNDSQNSIILDNKPFQLLQFHLHTPSEEAIDGRHSDMVIHFVHSNEDKTLAVVGLLFDIGEENPALEPLLAALPKESGDNNTLAEPFDIKSLLPENKDYYSFMGSLTTPPCSEGVHWQVLKQHVTLSEAQLEQIKAVVSPNARPIQPLNDREIIEVDQN
ncbi:carbonic anhydrase [Thorsellia anophelis]|uniref:carbonic anhydrase n=1 Tax=Thorsellia anophelis DSM 18579 TaxID=1123402 RepID=A0A1I0F8A3_9GAMM|nr:carbonic anhydrase family protein [Thorsellia anophelis]SET54212.1 carbonic anhydrase [Thorsellia anophelis DSM 18579]